jgi:hypothetical protein
MPEPGAGSHASRDAGTPRPLAEDALRLVSSVQDWAQGWADGWAERHRGEASGPHLAAECQWCPLCQFVAVLRGERPEVTERLTEAGTALLAAVRAVAEAAAGGAAGDGAGASSGDPGAPATPRVQKIDLGDGG